MTTTAEIWQLIEPYLAAERLELDDLEFSGQGKGRVLRVAVDGDNVDIDRLADVSQGISRMLDNETSLEGFYQLEVTTPGLERNLRRPEHYRKSVGREIVAKVERGGERHTVRGVIAGADETAFTVEAPDGPQVLRYDDVIKAKTVFRWEKAPKPGH